ncbi:peptidoglycan-binding protein [Streptomyces sp. NPDC091281]|uniref:peptidoglycan-binding domain-containing protein n=1 Tax=Streptomyces sp. NPDC091281 TaxID=3365985 RepID=UPI00380BF37F
MNDPTDIPDAAYGEHPCPRCGAPRAADRTPSCACARLTADALRDTREAEAAAAEDFDPLRIRPYVELEVEGGAGGAGGASGGATGAAEPGTETGTEPGTEPEAGPGGPKAGGGGAGAGGGAAGAVDATTELPRVRPDSAPRADDATMALHAVRPPGATLATPLAPSGTAPSATDLSLFEAGGAGPGVPEPGGDRPGGRRRRRTLLVAGGAAAVTALAAAGLLTGLFGYDAPSRDGAAPEGVRAAVPDASSRVSASASPSVSASPSASSASPSASESASPSASPSASEATPSASAADKPSPSASDAASPAPSGPDNGIDGEDGQGGQGGEGGQGGAGGSGGPVLRFADHGPEVIELQLRLRQLRLFNDDADGVFSDRVENSVQAYQWSRGIEDEDYGVYGEETRFYLEAETREP